MADPQHPRLDGIGDEAYRAGRLDIIGAAIDSVISDTRDFAGALTGAGEGRGIIRLDGQRGPANAGNGNRLV